ncbi:hypothetical protein DC080_09455 [Ignatzschineria cameli]|nr:hypothetical protein DC080_09455 [Ignatzschineria cameli]
MIAVTISIEYRPAIAWDAFEVSFLTTAENPHWLFLSFMRKLSIQLEIFIFLYFETSQLDWRELIITNRSTHVATDTKEYIKKGWL